LTRVYVQPTTWNHPVCGGEFRHGTNKCKTVSTGRQVDGKDEYFDKCYCIKKPTKNYCAYYLLIQHAYSARLHISSNEQDWHNFATKFWKYGHRMATFEDHCSGRNLQRRLVLTLDEAQTSMESGHEPQSKYEELLAEVLQEYIPWKEEQANKTQKSGKRKQREEGVNLAQRVICQPFNNRRSTESFDLLVSTLFDEQEASLWRIIKEKNEKDSLLRKEEREIQREANELKRMELNMISERFKEADRSAERNRKRSAKSRGVAAQPNDFRLTSGTKSKEGRAYRDC
jgi:hypothetical protein